MNTTQAKTPTVPNSIEDVALVNAISAENNQITEGSVRVTHESGMDNYPREGI